MHFRLELLRRSCIEAFRCSRIRIAANAQEKNPLDSNAIKTKATIEAVLTAALILATWIFKHLNGLAYWPVPAANPPMAK